MGCEECQYRDIVTKATPNGLTVVACNCVSPIIIELQRKYQELSRVVGNLNTFQLRDKISAIDDKIRKTSDSEVTKKLVVEKQETELCLQQVRELSEVKNALEGTEKDLQEKIDYKSSYLHSLPFFPSRASGGLSKLPLPMQDALDQIISRPQSHQYVLIYGSSIAQSNEALSRILWELADHTGETTEHISEELLMEALAFDAVNQRSSQKSFGQPPGARLQDLCSSKGLNVVNLVHRARKASYFAIYSALTDPPLPDFKLRLYREFLERRLNPSHSAASITFIAISNGPALSKIRQVDAWREILGFLALGKAVDALTYGSANKLTANLFNSQKIGPHIASSPLLHETTKSRLTNSYTAAVEGEPVSRNDSGDVQTTPAFSMSTLSEERRFHDSALTEVRLPQSDSFHLEIQPETAALTVPLLSSDVGNIALFHNESGSVVDRNQIPFVRTILRHSGVIFPCLSTNERSTLTKKEYIFYEVSASSKTLVARFEEVRGFVDQGHKKVGKHLRFFKGGLGGASFVKEEDLTLFRQNNPLLQCDEIESDETHGAISITESIYGNALSADGKNKQIHEFGIRGAYCDVNDLKLLGSIWASLYALHESNPNDTQLSLELKQSQLLNLVGKHPRSSTAIEWLQRALWRLSNMLITYREKLARSVDGVEREFSRELIDVPFLQFSKIFNKNKLKHYEISIPEQWKIFFAKQAPALSFVDKKMFAGLPSYACHLFNFMSTHTVRPIKGQIQLRAETYFFTSEELAKGAIWVELNIQEWRMRLGAGMIDAVDSDGNRRVIRREPLDMFQFKSEFMIALKALKELGLLNFCSYDGFYIDRANKRKKTAVFLVKAQHEKLH